MSRDYKGRANPGPQKKPEPRSGGWIWFLAGLLLGLFIAGLTWLKLGPELCGTLSPKAPVPKTEARPSAPAPVQEKPAEAVTTKPRFDFYTLLPEMEVLVPEPEEAPTPAPAPVVEGTPPAAAPAYVLQMGSFRKYEDADRLKASLALLGIEAEIQKVNINNKETYHRVRSGPYHSRKQVDELRARLKQNNVSSMLIQLKQ